MMEKQITIELANNHTEWGLAIRDKLGVTHSWASLNAREVERLIDGINAAAEQGAGRAMGYLRLGTYILDTEQGTSLRAAGWTMVGAVTGRSWNCPSRPRVDKHPTQGKLRWEICA